jgi:hypothetical protein
MIWKNYYGTESAGGLAALALLDRLLVATVATYAARGGAPGGEAQPA